MWLSMHDAGGGGSCKDTQGIKACSIRSAGSSRGCASNSPVHTYLLAHTAPALSSLATTINRQCHSPAGLALLQGCPSRRRARSTAVRIEFPSKRL